MSNPDKLLRIKQVADLLGVSTRTVYRRIWAEDLPAVKIGGLYYVRQADLDQSFTTINPNLEIVSPKITKCSACLKILRDPEKIAQRCNHPGCLEVICTDCLSKGRLKCRAHQGLTASIPLRKQDTKPGPVKIRASQARLREINYLNRLRTRIRQIESLAHPRTGALLSIPDWEAILRTGDDRAEVLRLKGKVLLDSRESGEQPLNAWLKYLYKPLKGEQTEPLVIEIRVINRLDVMVSDGFDTYPLDEQDLEDALIHASETQQADTSFRLLVLASPTGWKKEAQEIIFGTKTQKAFSSENLLVYLYDMQSNELIYPLKDIRSVQYAELFNPALLSEEAMDAEIEIENLMLEKGHSSLTLINAVKELPFSEAVLLETFKRMAKKRNYRLVDLEDIGLAIQRI